MENTYADGDHFICPDCFHEWPLDAATEGDSDGDPVVRDANGTPLADGDSVILIKDLKVKGSSTTLKKGVKARNIRLREGDHEVDCKIDSVSYLLKACFLKKASESLSRIRYGRDLQVLPLDQGSILDDGVSQRLLKQLDRSIFGRDGPPPRRALSEGKQVCRKIPSSLGLVTMTTVYLTAAFPHESHPQPP